ncbi:MAG: G5 domain-containing protein [Clostridia bacterium]|nr:G5 domain-containing protein [Clostridia bacterium]
MSSKTRLKGMAKRLVSKGLCMRLIALVTIFSMSVIFYGFTDNEKEAEFKTVSIIDAEQHYEVVTQSETVAEAIALAGITLGENDIVSAELDAEINDGDVIYLNRSKLIYLETSGKVFEFYTNENTVGEALLTDGFLVGKYDEVIPDVNTATYDGMTISVKRVYIELSEITEEIPFETITVDNPNEYMGYENVLQEGVNGSSTRTYKLVTKEDTGVTAILIAETRKEPVKKIVEVGTKLVTPESMTVIKGKTPDGVPYSALPAMAQSNSKTVVYGNTAITPYGSFAFKDVIEFKATAYEGSSASNGIWAGQTATGRAPVYGVVAVDPSVIPLNSKLYIESADGGQSWIYGFCVAGDTGGAIKGNRVDLCYSTLEQCYQFGRRNCRVYILE